LGEHHATQALAAQLGCYRDAGHTAGRHEPAAEPLALLAVDRLGHQPTCLVVAAEGPLAGSARIPAVRLRLFPITERGAAQIPGGLVIVGGQRPYGEWHSIILPPRSGRPTNRSAISRESAPRIAGSIRPDEIS
jgi:hypothetical protein